MRTMDPLLVSKKDAATLLGFSVRWLSARIAAGEVPVVRAGRAVRIRSADLATYAASGKWPPKAQRRHAKERT
jgi:excisionase family DNA binding protein